MRNVEFIEMYGDEIKDLVEKINESPEWENDLVDELIGYAMRADEKFEEKVAWLYEFRENNYNVMGQFIGDDEEKRYEYENFDWEAAIYEAAEILGVEIQ